VRRANSTSDVTMARATHRNARMTEQPTRPRPALPALLIILGAPNDAHGELLPIAEARARAAICEYRRRPDCKIVVTGGHGRHFNTSGIPHAHHVARFLVAH